MSVLLYLIPAALLLGLLGLLAFLWAMRTDQFADLDGAAERILYDDDRPPAARHPDKASAAAEHPASAAPPTGAITGPAPAAPAPPGHGRTGASPT